MDETRGIIERLRERFPAIVGPRTDDICYATTNRQAAVRKLADACDVVLVIGSRNSSNSLRLVEVARDLGAQAHSSTTPASWTKRGSTGCAPSASPPARARPRTSSPSSSSSSARAACSDVSELTVTREDVRFMLPKTIRAAAAAS